MYYSKTFVAGQFSPDYWEVKLYDVLRVGSTGKAFVFDPIPVVANMSSAVHIDIMDIDETDIERSNLQAYPLSILSHDRTTYKSSLSGTSLGILDTKYTVWQSDKLYSTKKLSSFSSSLTDIYARYESSMLSVVTGNLRDIEGSYAGKYITATDPSHVTCDIGLSSVLDTALQDTATEARLIADQHEVIDFVDNVSNFKRIAVSLEESPFTV